MVNHLSLFEGLKEMKGKLDLISVDIQQQRSAPAISPFKQDVSKMKTQETGKSNRTLSSTNGTEVVKNYESKKKFQTQVMT